VIRLLLPLLLLLVLPAGRALAKEKTPPAEGDCRAAIEAARSATERAVLHFDEAVRAVKAAGKVAIRERNRPCLNTVRFELARLYLKGGEYRKALGVLRKFLKVSPAARSNAEVNNLVGVAYYYEERYEEASHFFKRALRFDPTLKVALFNLKSINQRLLHLNAARAYQKAKDYEKALDEFNALLWASPNFVNGRYRLGLLYNEMGRRDDAMREFRRAYNLNPRHRQAPLLLKSMGDIEAARGDLVKAVELYTRALELKPNYPEAEKELEKYQFQQ